MIVADDLKLISRLFDNIEMFFHGRVHIKIYLLMLWFFSHYFFMS